MEIQKILFPEVGRCTEKKLYFRTEQECSSVSGDIPYEQTLFENEKKALAAVENNKKIEYLPEEKKIRMQKGAVVTFDTYFNGFSIEKWKKYTVIGDVSVKLVLSGRFRVTLLTKEKIKDDVLTHVVSETVVENEQAAEVEFPYTFADAKGMYTFMLTALEDGSIFAGGSYHAAVAEGKVRDVKIGIAICTFKREPFIEKNLRILNENILNNPASPLHGHLEVFVADNGQSLDRERLSSDKIHINPNRNLGGAGGFTRDLIEIMTHNEELCVTHALLMDDDIVIEPEALVKTYQILTLLKDEYEDAFIGGAMLRLDKQAIQVEAGASWNGGWLKSLKHDLDLRKCDSCLYNEIEEYTEFNAWWYCCFPMKIVTPENLPMPIFIRGDDLEYGLRNMKTLILMNGICVWHEPFENKYSSFLEYYIMRNQLIDNSFHCQWYGARQLNRAILGHCFREVTFYRYKNVDLYLQGIKDFLKGPGWLMEQDGEALHKSVMAAGYRGQELNTLDVPFDYPTFEKSYKYVDSKISKIKRLLTLNGLFLRAKGNNVVPMSAARPALFYRKKKVLQYDVTSHKGFVTEKSFKTSMRCLFSALGLTFTVRFKLKKAQNAWRTEGLKLRTLEFWNGFLGLN